MSENLKFSVLLSVYSKEKRKNLELSLKSIYDDQILKPDEIVLVEDGPLTEELYAEINHQLDRLKGILKIIKLEKNSGLGNALKEGVLHCTYEWIARMDTDDIAYPERFKKQIEYIKKNPDIDVLGTFMTEFIDEITNKICVKDAPISNIDNYIKYRDPVNHPSVILRKSKVLEAGNYQEIFLNEDSYLWARMYSIGAKFANIPEELVYFRVDDNTYKRRGGWKYIKAEWKLQKEYLRLGIINKIGFWKNVCLKSCVRLMPNFLRKFIYLKVLRK